MNPTNEQELRDRLFELWRDGRSDNDRYNSVNAAEEWLIDWHNKQVEEVLDRLEQEVKITIYDGDDTFGKEYQAGYNSMAEATRIYQLGIMSAVQAEIEKLKEVK